MKYETNPKEWSNAKKKRERFDQIYENGAPGRVFFSAVSAPYHYSEPISPYALGVAAHVAIDDAVREPDQRPRSDPPDGIGCNDLREIQSIFAEGVRAGAENFSYRDADRQRAQEWSEYISDVAEVE